MLDSIITKQSSLSLSNILENRDLIKYSARFTRISSPMDLNGFLGSTLSEPASEPGLISIWCVSVLFVTYCFMTLSLETGCCNTPEGLQHHV